MTIYFKQPELPQPISLSERLGMDGRCIFVNKQHFPILAEDNDAELVHVWVAEKRRAATLDMVADDVPFTIIRGALA